MWFRNARLYRITKAFDWSAEALEEVLSRRALSSPVGHRTVSALAGCRRWGVRISSWFSARVITI